MIRPLYFHYAKVPRLVMGYPVFIYSCFLFLFEKLPPLKRTVIITGLEIDRGLDMEIGKLIIRHWHWIINLIENYPASVSVLFFLTN